MKIKNCLSINTCRPVANQFIIDDDENKTIYLQSYKSMICKIDFKNNIVVIGRDWDYSQTTRKYFYYFLRDNLRCVNFDWNKNTIQELLKTGCFIDRFNFNWTITYNENL